MPSRVAPSDRPADAQQPEVVQQRQEVLGFDEFLQRKAEADVGLGAPRAGDVAQQVEVAVQPGADLPARHQQVPQLAVVDAHVDVDQVVGRRLIGHAVLQVVEHHVGVVEVAPRVFGEAVAVVPLVHHLQRRIDVLVERAAVPVQRQQAPHLLLGEAEQVVEPGAEADVRSDVEAARHVVHRDGRDPGDEQPLEAAAALAGPRLQGGEEVAVEAAAVRERLVRLAAVVGQHRVGEVVVLVDEAVHRDVVVAGIGEQLAETAVDRGRGEDAADRRLGEQVGVALERAADHHAAVALEALAQGLQGVVEGREVEPQDDVPRAVLRRFPADVGAVEDGAPLVGAAAVVVVLEHRHPEALAQAPGPDEEDVALVLEPAEEPGLGRRRASPSGGCA